MKGARGRIQNTPPREAAQPHRNQENTRTGRRSRTILSSHRAHQGTAISDDTAQRAARRMPRMTIPALSHLNTLFVHEAAPESP